MRTVTTTRVVLDKEERAIAKSWGSEWARIRADVKKYGRACILTGTWSGYTSSQQRGVHTEYVKNDHSRGMVLKNIVFTDGTSLFVDIRAYTIEQILEWKIKRMKQYDHLVEEARSAMVETFYVGQENNPPQIEHREPEPKPAEETKPVETGTVSEKSRKEKIKEEQMGKNWYDR